MSERGDGERTTTTTWRRKSTSNTRDGGTRTWNMTSMFVTELTSQSPMGSLKAWATYSAARVGQSCGVSSDVGARGWGTDDDDMAMQEQQQHAGWRNTYIEHAIHGRHRAHVPITDGLIEDRGFLQGSEGRVAVRSERRSLDGIEDGRRRRRRHADARTATREMEEHVRRTCSPCPSPSSCPRY